MIGPSGAGKTVLARKVHEERCRFLGQTDRPFFSFNIATFNEETIESSLFGHEKGAFTGAYRQKQGIFELADGGTVFLDEIGEASPSLQTKLLTVVESGTFYRMGGEEKELKSTFKLICATNRNLEAMVDQGTFQ